MGWRRVACECCTPPTCVCSDPSNIALPVACSVTTYSCQIPADTDDASACSDAEMTVSVGYNTWWEGNFGVCPAPACYSIPCEGELSDTVTFPWVESSGDYSYTVFDDESLISQGGAPCCPSTWVSEIISNNGDGYEVPARNINLPDPDTIFNAFSVTFDIADAGADVSAHGGEDLCRVYASRWSNELRIDYVYNGGVCRRRTFEVGSMTYHSGESVSDWVACINTQTTGRAASDLGLTGVAVAGGTKLMNTRPFITTPRIRIDDGTTFTYEAFEPPSVYFTRTGYLGHYSTSDPTIVCLSCPDGGGLICADWEYIAQSETKTRLTSDQDWDDSMCLYNYSDWTMIELGENIISASMSMAAP